MEENLYELLYMSRMGDAYARKTLFSYYRKVAKIQCIRVENTDPRMAAYEEDLIQEGLITMMRAQELYREDMHASYATYTAIVIRRKILNVIRHYKSHEYVNVWCSVSLDEVNESGEVFESDPIDLGNPVYYADFFAAVSRVRRLIASLSSMEQLILRCSNEGMSYAQGAAKAGISVKAYDGRLQRLKSRVKKAIFAQ